MAAAPVDPHVVTIASSRAAPALRVGLVGAGPWAQMFTAPTIASGPGTTLAGVWARRPEAAEEIASLHGGAVAATFEDLLDCCDAVAFAVSPDVQGALAPRAAAAGKHLLLEKPLAFTVADAEAIAVAAEKAGVVTQMVLTNRYTTPVRDFLARVRNETVRAVTGEFIGGAALVDSPFATPWRTKESALYDIGPHVLDLLEAVAGRAIEVYAVREPSGCLGLTLRHRAGLLSQAMLSSTTPHSRGPLRCEALTDAGRISMGDPGTQQRSDVQRVIVDEFSRTVRGELPQSLNARHGLRLQRLLAAADRSLDIAAPVAISADDVAKEES